MSDELPKNELPEDDLTVLDASAMRLHEIYSSLIRAGFSRRQAEGFTAELVTEEFSNTGEPL